jgi:hypothetical protein
MFHVPHPLTHVFLPDGTEIFRIDEVPETTKVLLFSAKSKFAGIHVPEPETEKI